MNYLILILIIIAAYFYGCISTARVVAKTFRSLNIYKVGTGLADTENIFVNVSRPLGVLVGLLDILKAFLFLILIEYLARWLNYYGIVEGADLLYNKSIMLLYGLAMLIGHCLPITNNFKGGRGIFTYSGYLLYFVPGPMIISLIVAGFITFIWKQVRFAQYVLVILPVLLTHIFYAFIPYFRKGLPPHFIVIIWAIAIIMGVLNFILSKRLGEI
ncbi:MAG TPA: glycerol-3-phosphate acyltransferase [Candidatus Syntrophosphaera sp.]|nr:MAG: Glycerol-3-phosphate acyltransferase [Candidatus Cloacimonetes bacterium ADurb.Bin211]HOD59359.1 glycerol-3-phosphate acyltransferase [Candidatus Syntrophosphaera sp.]HQM79405.1 glycerol-3-phosphate acyltransferase [Candidatus Syntrophosphaera sp.]